MENLFRRVKGIYVGITGRDRKRWALVLILYYTFFAAALHYLPVGKYWETTLFYDALYFLLPAAVLVYVSGGWKAVLPGSLAVGITMGVLYHNVMYLSDSYSFYTLVHAGGIPYFWNVFWHPMVAFLVLGVYTFWTEREAEFDYFRGFFLLAGSFALLGVFIAHRQAIVSLLESPKPYLYVVAPALVLSALIIGSRLPTERLRSVMRTAPLLTFPFLLYSYLSVSIFRGVNFDSSYLFRVPVMDAAIPVEEFFNWGLMFPLLIMIIYEWTLEGEEEGSESKKVQK
ncbi:MAG: hypothetical protein ABEJ69_00025 [Candidatus Nanohaloarchaea archaeon]